MRPNPWGIRKRAIFLALAPTAIIAVALSVYFLVVRYGDVEEALQNRGQSLVRQLAPADEYGAFSGNRNELQRLVQAVAGEPDVVNIAIYDSAGRLLANAGEPRAANEARAPKAPQHATSIGGDLEIFQADIKRPDLSFDDPFQAAESTLQPPDKPLGRVVIELSRANLEARKREILAVTLLTTILVLASALLLARRLSHDIIEPVVALEDAVARIRAGTLDVRIPPHPSGTLISLETGFNEMATALDAGHRRSARALAQSEAELARQLEIAQAKKEEAERASEGKSRFLAAASHDLRQPLHALTLFATELSAAVTKPRDRRLAAQIVTAAGAMAELLDALLDVARLDIAAVQPQRRAMPLDPLLETIADANRQSAKAKGLKLTCRPTAFWVESDPHLLRRMIGNLVANAVRYTRSGGVLVAARPSGDRIRIDVWDSGIGIDDAHLPYLFHEFYQVGNQERDSAQGLGLGLSIVARLGEILDHPVTVRSRLGHGSMFSISLPSAAPEWQSAVEPPAGLPFRARVAVRTDAGDRCRDICRLLDVWGYQALCACSDEDLVQSLHKEPSVLICDAGLLDEVARQFMRLSSRPLLVVLGDSESGSPPEVRIDGRLSLPPRPARLRALLHHLLLEIESGTGQSPTTTL
jgi:two-component system, sensor histidine kinase